MILQALTEHYEALAAQGKFTNLGWGKSNISFALRINDAGELTQVVDVRTPPKSGKGKMIPRSIDLPSPPNGRTSLAVKPAFLWDNARYLLGIDNKGKAQQSIQCFEGSRTFYHQLLDGVESPAAKAVLNFFDCWDPSQAREHPALADSLDEILKGVNLIFRYESAYVHEDPLIQQAWTDFYDHDVEEDSCEMVCLVTGKKGPVERTHPKIKKNGDSDWQPMGNTLVGFNAPAFCSYGHTQSFNAPVSRYAAFAYTTALNCLLADREHLYRVGETTILFWAKSGQPAFQDFFAAMAFGGTACYDAGTLGGMLKSLLEGKPVLYDETRLDPGMDFYILGISPNAARLSVRFFLRNSFGGFLENVQRHNDRLEIIRPANDSFESIPPWKLVDATVNQNSKDKSPSPVMTGEVLRAILTDTHYPVSLLNGVTLRIRADHKVDRTRAAILKAYYLKKPHPDIPKEVLTVSLNPACDTPAYVLGRLFSVYEAIQSAANPGINTTIKDKYFNSAAATPAVIFPILGNLAQKHLKKLKSSNRGLCVFYEKQLGEVASLLDTSFPARMSLPQQGAFQLGYYHQTQDRYQKKEDK